ncbi:MAG: hypothetical protein JO291_04160 [Acidimicrobiia bacterium]|nr:hypothetical protein [Acidimicrobiia bacterium]
MPVRDDRRRHDPAAGPQYRLTAGPAAAVSGHAAVLGPGAHTVALGVGVGGWCGAAAQRLELRWEVRAGPGSRLQVLLPATPRHRYVFPGHRAAWVPEDLRGRLVGSVRVHHPPG